MVRPARRATLWWIMPAVGVLLAGLLLTLALWDYSVRQYRLQLQRDFEAHSVAIKSEVAQRLGIYSHALRSAVALFDATGEVSHESWQRFIAGMRLEENYPGLVAMAYARNVRSDEIGTVLEQVRRDGIPDFTLRPPGERPNYVIVTHVEPMTSQNRLALGYDGYHDAQRRQVMDTARDTASQRITAKLGVTIDTGANPQPAVIMYLPVYRGRTPEALAERRDQLLGFVLCPIRIPELMPHVLGNSVNRIGFSLYDGTTENEATLLYRNAHFAAGGAPLLTQRQSLQFGGREWTMVFNSAAAAGYGQGAYRPGIVLGSGIVLSLLVAMILLSMASTRHRAIGLAEQMTRSLRSAKVKWQSLFTQAPLGIALMSRDGQVTDCNHAYCTMIGATRSQAMGLSPASETFRDSVKPYIHKALSGQKVTFDSPYLSPDGKTSHFRYRLQMIEQDGDFSTLLAFVEDISEQHHAAERIAFLAQYDNLTGLANRVLLKDRLNQAILASKRRKKHLAVLFLDLDHFKNINDSLGHTLGDGVLIQIAQRLVATVRGSDTVARLGGDEFVIVLRDVDASEAVVRVSEKLMECITAPVHLEGHTLAVTGSIGIALFPENGNDVDTLIKNADAAMYHAKGNSRNNFQFFTPDMNARVVEAHEIEVALHRTLRGEEGRFLLHYQPQVSIPGNALVGMEALIRWERPKLGLVPPNSFISVAENRGLISSIGEWVLNEACRQNRIWQDMGLPAVPMAVNISASQLRNDSLVGIVRRALADSGLDARYLELEITESALAHNIEFAIGLMDELKSLGVKISIDDFGTGYSSLSYLKRFPIDKLKIDRSFIRDISTDKDDAAITQAIIAMGKSLNMKVIAEGVETIEQLRFLELHQCDEAQGYLFSKALGPGAIEQILENYPVAGKKPRISEDAAF
ncbi:MAG: Sensory box/GGDEF family protein [Herminiimonas sp.]|nr:Sensory box/GGDEF family protein [Herminiimonas sp.]